MQREGLVTLQVSGACGGNSRSLLTNANDVQGVNEKYRGKTLFLNLEGKKKRRKKKKERKIYRVTNQPPKSLTYISLLSLEPFLK